MPLVECVANVSEGRDEAVLDRISESIRSVPGTHLLDRTADPDHHRSVFTFIGGRRAVEEAAFRLILVASASIDLNRHAGVHPRIGAADVVPFVPLHGVNRGDLVALARRLALRVGRELSIPGYLYGDAATTPDRRLLVPIRRGQFERLRDVVATDPTRCPDAGPTDRLHPTAGATALGVRGPLVAFNVLLDGGTLDQAREIARSIRASAGGLPGVQAMGTWLPGRDAAQVSMNLMRPFETGPREAWLAIVEAAARHGTRPLEGELIGLAPAATLDAATAEMIRLPRFDPDRMLVEPAVERTTGLVLPHDALRRA